MTLAGVFPSVALSGGLGTLAVREGSPRDPGWLAVYLFPYAKPDQWTRFARFPLPAGSPCFPNLYILDGLTWLAYHDGERQRLHNLTTARDVLVVPGLSNPSAFGAGAFAWTEPGQPYQVNRLNLRSGEVDQPRLGAPTGLSRILDDGSIVTIDEDRHALPWATIPAFAGPLAVGEGPDGGVVWRFQPPTSHLLPPTSDPPITGVLYAGLTSFTPKCAADGNILAITTAGPDVRLFCGTLDALIAASQAPAQPPAPPPPSPIPIPPPAPKETPMEMPADVYTTYTACVARFPHTGSDDDRRVAHRKAVATVRARHGGRWVCKSEHNLGWGSDSKDAVGRVADGVTPVHGQKCRMFIWDMIVGDTRQPKPRGESEEARDAYALIPEAFDWLTGATDPVDPGEADTHLYMGGGNDTGTCDACGQSRFDAVHAIPQSRAKHVYNGGEQDSGLCDVCQKGAADAIHQWSVPPVPPPAPPAPPPPNNPPAPVDLGPLTAQVQALRETLNGFKADLEALASRPVVDQAAVGAAVALMLEGYEVSGRTGRDRLGLQHDVRLAITKRK